jgi:hypothetical protein
MGGWREDGEVVDEGQGVQWRADGGRGVSVGGWRRMGFG